MDNFCKNKICRLCLRNEGSINILDKLNSSTSCAEKVLFCTRIAVRIHGIFVSFSDHYQKNNCFVVIDKKHRQSTKNDMQMLHTTTEFSLPVQSTSNKFRLQTAQCNQRSGKFK